MKVPRSSTVKPRNSFIRSSLGHVRTTADRSGAGNASFRPDAGELDHLGPSLRVFADELGEPGRAGAGRVEPLWQHALLLELRIPDHAVEADVELFDDVTGCACRRDDAPPGARVHLRVALLREGRHIAEQRRALIAAHGEAAHLAIADQPGSGYADKRRLHGAAQEIGQDLGDALGWNMHERYASELTEHLHGEMRLAAVAERSVVERAR